MKIEHDGGQKRDDLPQGLLGSYLPLAQRDGKLYRAEAVAGLDIMMKLPPDTPGTDGSWIYGTVTADRKKVTSAGRVESCIACHADADGGDRLFGLTPLRAEDALMPLDFQR